MWRVLAQRRLTRGGTSLAAAKQTAVDAAALRQHKPSRSDRFGRTPLVSTTWKAMSGSGSKIFGTTVTKAHRPTARPGSRAMTQPFGLFAQDPGTTRPNSSARPFGSSVTGRGSSTLLVLY